MDSTISKIDKGIHLLGVSPSIKEIKKIITTIAPTDATVLITGESGCGKEIVAEAIHNLSNRADNRYVKINCAAIPENLLESELFGYERGAFTGSHQKDKPGMFELASDGTLLLDEIGEMPLGLQAKILRVIQEKDYIRLGGKTTIKVNTRIIAATNQDLNIMVKQGKFRLDLYYRLNVIPIFIPPLRERREDISLLVTHFLGEYNRKYGKRKYFSVDAINLIEHRKWLGNVRELKNFLERMVLTCDEDEIGPATLGRIFMGEGKASEESSIEYHTKSLSDMVDAYEKEIIKGAIQTYKTTYKAAEALYINQSTLYRKAKKYKLL
ncbi:MAG TPA: sigma 54-interacting transcriptional regulator [Anaerovoracaceae bacterium]|nr:sigma 54-interacting transcriptional regulator [Anaerovoracaceae bacterium]